MCKKSLDGLQQVSEHIYKFENAEIWSNTHQVMTLNLLSHNMNDNSKNHIDP